MRFSKMIPATRLCSMLCIALALVFAGSSLASALDRIQHAPGGTPAHEHMLFSEIALEDAHDRAHHAPDQSDESSSDQLGGGHHHHGDSGVGLFVMAAGDARLSPPSGDNPGFVPDRLAIAARLSGPERPPKGSTVSA